MKRKTISIILVALVLCLCAVPVAFAAPAEEYVAYAKLNDTVIPYTSFAQAVEETKGVPGVYVYLVGHAEIGEYMEIPAGMTVVIATSEKYELDTEIGNNVHGVAANPTGYYGLLQVPTGSKLDVNGTLIVAGNQQSTQPQSGFLYGAYGAVELNGDMNIGETGILYARGSIFGSGSITAADKSTVYQRFEIADWRGGTQTTLATLAGVFPFSLYQLGGISVKTTYNTGSKLYGQVYIYARDTDVNVNIHYFADDGLIRPTVSGGNVEFTYSEDGTTNVNVNASVQTGDLKFDEAVSGESFPLDSSNFYCPFGYKVNVNISDGASVSVETKLKVMPGCKIVVNNGGKLNVGSKGTLLFFLGESYLSTYNFAGWSTTSNAVLENLGQPTDVTIEQGGVIGSTAQDYSNIIGTNFENKGTLRLTEYLENSLINAHITFYTYTA